MTVLAFDTATSSCAITVWRDGEALAETQKFLARGHAEVLVPMIEDTLSSAGLDYADLKLLAVTIGPGAFTGIRIGLATARALALASDLPLLGICNFDALVHATSSAEREGRNVVVVLETKRADFYLQVFDEFLVPVTEPKAVDEEALKTLVGDRKVLLCGDVSDRVSNILVGVNVLVANIEPFVATRTVAKLANEKFNAAGPTVKFAPPSPLYLKPPDVNMTGVKPPFRVIPS